MVDQKNVRYVHHSSYRQVKCSSFLRPNRVPGQSWQRLTRLNDRWNAHEMYPKVARTVFYDSTTNRLHFRTLSVRRVSKIQRVGLSALTQQIRERFELDGNEFLRLYCDRRWNPGGSLHCHWDRKIGKKKVMAAIFWSTFHQCSPSQQTFSILLVGMFLKYAVYIPDLAPSDLRSFAKNPSLRNASNSTEIVLKNGWLRSLTMSCTFYKYICRFLFNVLTFRTTLVCIYR